MENVCFFYPLTYFKCKQTISTSENFFSFFLFKKCGILLLPEGSGSFMLNMLCGLL